VVMLCKTFLGFFFCFFQESSVVLGLQKRTRSRRQPCEAWAGLGVIDPCQACETGMEEPCAGSWVLLGGSRGRTTHAGVAPFSAP